MIPQALLLGMLDKNVGSLIMSNLNSPLLSYTLDRNLSLSTLISISRIELSVKLPSSVLEISRNLGYLVLTLSITSLFD